MSVFVKRSIAIFAPVVFVVIAVGYFLLSGSTFYATLVADKVGDAFRDMGGYDMVIGSLSGNPLTGVNGEGVRIVHDGVEIISADKVEMRLDLASVVASPRLSRLSLSGLTADLDTVMDHLPKEKKESSGPPALERLTLRDSKITASFGDIDISDMILFLGDGNYGIDAKGAYFSREFSIEADLTNSDGEMSLSDFAADWGGMTLEARGTVTPKLGLICAASGIDADVLSEIVPQIKSSTARGVYSVKAGIRQNEDGLAADGEIHSGAGGISIVPFDALSANFDYARNRISLRDLNVSLFGGAMSGDVTVDLVSGAPPLLTAEVTASDVDTGAMREVFPWLENFVGRLGISCDLAGPVNALDGTASLSAKKFDVFGFTASDVSSVVRLSDSSALELSFGARAMGAKINGGGGVTLKPGVRLALDVDASGVSLETLANSFPRIKDAGVSGIGDARVKIHGPANALAFSGSVSFPTLTAKQEYELSDVAASFSYDESGLALSEARATFNEATLTAEGSRRMNLLDGLETLDFQGTLSNFKIEKFSRFAPAIKENHLNGTVSAKWNLNGTLADPSVRVGLCAPALSLLNRFTLTNVSADAVYASGLLELASASAAMGKASVAAAGEIVMPSEDKSLAYDVKGSFKDLNPDEFVKMGLVSADLSGDLAGDFRVWGENGAPPSASVSFDNSHIIYSNMFDISNLMGSVTLRDGNIRFDSLRTVFNSGFISLTGTVGNATAQPFVLEKIPLDMEVSIASADIGRISRLFMPNSKGYQGIITGSAEIKGSAADPRFNGNASLTGVRAFGLFLPIVRISDVSGGLNEILFPRVRAIVGRGVIDAHGSLAKADKTADWRASAEATGRSVDIRSLTFSLDREVRREINGTLDFDFKGSGWLDSFEGNGEIRVPTFSAMGIKITDFSAPFWINNGFVLIEDSIAKGYGGVLKAQVAKDLTLSNWGGRLEVLSADFASVIHDIMPDAEGTITGSADLILRIEGDSARTSLQDGSGSFEVRNGEISGFPGTEAVSNLIGGRPLRFSSAYFSFSIDGKTLYILPGSRVSSPSEDPVFKYVMVDGNVGIEEKRINISCIGNVNVRALNSFIGGLRSLVNAAMDDMGDTDALLHNFLGGALSGFSRNEFRDVSLVVKGTPDSLSFSDIDIAQPLTYDTMPEILNQTTNARENEENRFRLKVEIPVGPGGGHGSSLGSQVSGQVFEQAIKSLFSF